MDVDDNRNDLVFQADWSSHIPVGRSDPVERGRTGSDMVRFGLKLRNFSDGNTSVPIGRMNDGYAAFNDSFLSIKGTG